MSTRWSPFEHRSAKIGKWIAILIMVAALITTVATKEPNWLLVMWLAPVPAAYLLGLLDYWPMIPLVKGAAKAEFGAALLWAAMTALVFGLTYIM